MKKLFTNLFVVFSVLSLFALPHHLSATGNTPPPSYLLDSTLFFDIHGVNTLKTYYLYDEWGNQCSMESYTYSEYLKGYIGLTKKMSVYNSVGQEIANESYGWNSTTKKWVPSGRYEYTFEGKNNTQLIYSNWNSQSNAWIYSRKYDYQYHSSGKVQSEEQYIWNNTLMTWVNDYKNTKVYDDHGYLTTDMRYSWNASTSDWTQLQSSRFTNTYDTKGNLTSSITEIWNTSSNNWINTSKADSTYDELNRVTKYETFTWVSGNWQIENRVLKDYDQRGNLTKLETYTYSSYDHALIGNTYFVNEYDANNNVTQTLTYTWDYSTGKWVYSGKQIKSYGSEGKVLSSEDYYWDSMLSKWVGSYKETTTYEESTRTETFTTFQWNSTTDTWENSGSRYIRIFDVQGKLVSKETQFWNTSTSTWTNNEKELTTYTENGMIQSIERLIWFSEAYNRHSKTVLTYDTYGNLIVDESFLWNNSSSQYRSNQRIQYYYTAFVTGIKPLDQQPAGFTVSAANSMLRIQFASTTKAVTVRILDASGRLVNVVSGSNGTVQYVRIAKDGIYLLSDGKSTVKVRMN